MINNDHIYGEIALLICFGAMLLVFLWVSSRHQRTVFERARYIPLGFSPEDRLPEDAFNNDESTPSEGRIDDGPSIG